MSFTKRSIVAASLLMAGSLATPARPAEPQLPRDGWSSWEVPAVDGAPAHCCFDTWKNGNGSPVACKLDKRNNTFGTRDGDSPTDAVRLYARTTGGRLDSLHVYAARCPVEAKTPIQDLGSMTSDDSARFLIPLVKKDGRDAVNDRPLAEGALSALAMHRGDLARDSLATFARDPRTEIRKQSVFWLSMVRGTEGADITSSVMFSDQDPEVRQHASFALSQSRSPRVAADLIKLGNTDKVGEVRAQAWFWLAQSEAPEAEQAINAALRKDSDDDVREQAVFALSQLPDERATRALIAVAEDRSLSREQRKRAVFWLSQSESDSAQAYLEKVLARVSAH